MSPTPNTPAAAEAPSAKPGKGNSLLKTGLNLGGTLGTMFGASSIINSVAPAVNDVISTSGELALGPVGAISGSLLSGFYGGHPLSNEPSSIKAIEKSLWRVGVSSTALGTLGIINAPFAIPTLAAAGAMSAVINTPKGVKFLASAVKNSVCSIGTTVFDGVIKTAFTAPFKGIGYVGRNLGIGKSV